MAARCFLPTSRRGVAPLELVLALPLLVALLALLFTIADASIKANTSVIAARADAWSRRDNQKTKDALQFRSGATSHKLIHGNAEVATRSFLADIGASTAKAEHAVMGGSWDHRDIDLNSPPSYRLYARVGAGSIAELGAQLAGGIQVAVDSLPDYRATISEANNLAESVTGNVKAEINKSQAALNRLETETIPQLETEITKLEQRIDQHAEKGDVTDKVDEYRRLHLMKVQRGNVLPPTAEQRHRQLREDLADADGTLPNSIERHVEKQRELRERREEAEHRRAGIEKAKRGQTLIDQMQGF